METFSEIKRIAFLGNYLPRKCGIATFTADVCKSIAAAVPHAECFAVPVNDIEEGYAYPKEVRFEIEQQNLASYQQAADFLNVSEVDVVSLQHEFGIFGGPCGSNIVGLVRSLKMPVVTTLHTILKDPNPDQRRVMHELIAHSTRLITMCNRGRDFLQDIYKAPPEKIDVIPHGIHDMPFVDPSFFKDEFGVEGKQVLLTFGLLSPNKGIEHVLNAMPEILAEFPNVVYIVLGATHPALVREQGEAYRLSLERLAKKNNIQKNVIFHNRFVEIEELKAFIGACDIYITPYLNEAQIISGTLAYVFGAGKVVVSTPYWHAQELLAEDRGVHIPFADSKAIAREIIGLLRDEPRRNVIRKNAYKLGREMIWSNVAQKYLHSFEQARHERAGMSRKSFAIKTLDQQPRVLPDLKLDHLYRMTDSTGIFQHATYSVPNFSEGYCIDDNARALIFSVMAEDLVEEPERMRSLATSYAAFVSHAFDSKTKRFRNFMGFDRRWLETEGSQDSNGRTLWALGYCAGRTKRRSFHGLAQHLFCEALPMALELTAPRSWAFTLLGIDEYLQRLSGDRLANQIRDTLTNRLMQLFQKGSGSDWHWCEENVTYDNAKLAHALLRAGAATGQKRVVETGLGALRWLADLQTSEEGYFRPIGNKGFYTRGAERAQFDQQPIEAQSMVSACLEAHRLTKDIYWYEMACCAFDWFLGWNDVGLEVYSPNSGGCHDGLHVDRVNPNQGAESLLAFLLSLAELKLTQNNVMTFNPLTPALAIK